MREIAAANRIASMTCIAMLAACAARAESVAPAAPSAAAATAAPACSAPERRQFDFWLGDWDVSDASGRALGTNRVESLAGGCAMQEHWAAARGTNTGTSLTAFDPDLRHWHQTWMDSDGSVALLDGGFVDGRIVLSGDTGDGQARRRNRISWIPLADGRVRQWWEQSADDGKTWSTVFDGYYARRR